MHYETLNSKLPQLIKLNVLCEKLDMSLTNVQLPMFYRLIDLCLALYYGTIEVPEDARKKVPSATTANMPPGCVSEFSFVLWVRLFKILCLNFEQERCP